MCVIITSAVFRRSTHGIQTEHTSVNGCCMHRCSVCIALQCMYIMYLCAVATRIPLCLDHVHMYTVVVLGVSVL